jgi:hypothetical protein
MKVKLLLSLLVCSFIGLFAQQTASAADHPAYLHALSDLRAARWKIDHRPADDWKQSADEKEAVARIDEAIAEIKKASIDDGKDLSDHPKVDDHPGRIGRLHDAVDFLKKAREDVNREEDNGFAQGLKARALKHINEAIRRTELAIKS